MAIPDFTAYGLLPQGVHDCTLYEAEQLLCSNEHRSNIWAGLQRFLTWIQQYPAPAAILMDGSYVTEKIIPGDIDVIVDITNCSLLEQEIWTQIYIEHHDNAKQWFHVDFYLFVTGIGNDFSAFFQYVRIDEAFKRGAPLDTRKGILKVLQ